VKLSSAFGAGTATTATRTDKRRVMVFMGFGLDNTTGYIVGLPLKTQEVNCELQLSTSPTVVERVLSSLCGTAAYVFLY
jgi:hypothetical protein